jgi:hypothetical protein
MKKVKTVTETKSLVFIFSKKKRLEAQVEPLDILLTHNGTCNSSKEI